MQHCCSFNALFCLWLFLSICPLCACVYVCVRLYVYMHILFCGTVLIFTHTQYTQHTWNGECPEREREREEWKQRQQRPQHTIHTGKTTCVVATEVLPYLPLSLPLSTSFALSHFLSYRVACEFLRVFGYSFWFCFPSHTHTHMHTSAYKYVWMCAAALLLCLPFCWLPMLTMLCFFLPLIAAPRSRLQIFSSQKRDRVSPSA